MSRLRRGAGIVGIIVHSFNFKRILGPEIWRIDIRLFALRNNTFKPQSTSSHGKSLPITPHIFRASVQNSATNFGIKNLIEVPQEILAVMDEYSLMVQRRSERIVN